MSEVANNKTADEKVFVGLRICSLGIRKSESEKYNKHKTMSSSINYPEKTNPFFDDDDDDDEFSYGRLSSSSGPPKNSSNPPTNKGFGGAYGGGVSYDVTDDDFARPVGKKTTRDDSSFDSIQAQVDNSQNRQLESTQRALASIYESERMGVATAEVLLTLWSLSFQLIVTVILIF